MGVGRVYWKLEETAQTTTITAIHGNKIEKLYVGGQHDADWGKGAGEFVTQIKPHGWGFKNYLP